MTGNNEVYTIQNADTYWSISKRVYGTSKYYKALARYNERQVPDPRKMRPGTKLMIPQPAELERRYRDLFPSSQRSSESIARIDTTLAAGLYYDANDRPLYRVGNRDSLTAIAQRHLGRASRWEEIYRLNGRVLTSPTSIRPGMLLAMPSDASAVSTLR